MDTAKALLQPVRVPWQVVVDHQMRALEVDAFTGGIGGDQDANTDVLLEQILDLAALIAQHTAVNRNHSFLAAQQGADFVCEIV